MSMVPYKALKNLDEFGTKQFIRKLLNPHLKKAKKPKNITKS